MKVHITQWIGVRDQFSISVDVPQAQVYLKCMHPSATLGTVRLSARYAHVADDRFTDSYDERTHFNLKVPASEAHKILEVLQGDLSRFKGTLCIIHDIELEDIKNA